MLTCQVVFTGLTSGELPLPFRSAFCKVMLAVHVNREPQVGRVSDGLHRGALAGGQSRVCTPWLLCNAVVLQKLLQLPNNTRVWADARSELPTAPETGDNTFSQLKVFIIEHFTSCGGHQRSWEPELNYFTLQVLALCK